MYIKRPGEHNPDTHARTPGERRTIKRRHLIFYLRVWELDEDRALGHVVDITAEGMMLISEQPIATDREYSLEVRLPDTEGRPTPMRFRAVCRWCDNDINPAFYDSGFEFLEQGPQDVETIRSLIEEYGFQD
jgi:hypothetical protein